MSALWTTEAFVAAAGGRLEGHAARRHHAASRSTAARSGRATPSSPSAASASTATTTSPPRCRPGAALAVASEGRAPAAAGPLLVVPDDPLDALERVGAAARARMHGAVVAVTGSVGKTGTKEMLRLALSELGPTHAPVGSFNNHWGVPLTLARMPAETAYGVFEIGMNHAGEIRPLTKLVRPHVAIVTTVEPVHLAYFPDEAAIAEAKAEIFEGLEPGGTAVLNRDNRWFDLLAGRAREHGARILSFGEHASADVRLERVDLHADGSSVQAAVCGEPVDLPARRARPPSRAELACRARRRRGDRRRPGAGA